MRLSRINLRAAQLWLALLMFLGLPTGALAEDKPSNPNVGTAFLVTDLGHLVTSYHIIQGRAQILLGPMHNNKWIIAKVIHSDPKVDLALLKADILRPGLPIADWRSVPIGLEVFVIGYPQPDIMGMTSKITQGIINGYRAPQGPFQLSAEVQKGNSGGPVLAPDGSVVGVVMAKLNAMEVANRTKDLPQNVNYAQRSEVLLNFLREAGLNVESRPVNFASPLKPYEMYKKTEFSIMAVIARDQPAAPAKGDANAKTP